MLRNILPWSVALFLLAGCSDKKEEPKPPPGSPVMKITSSAFQEGASIPELHTGDGKEVSPPLKWEGEPAGTKSFVLICDDPDAPRETAWVHWLLFNIPPDRHELPQGAAATRDALGDARQGVNDFGNVSYGGPAPPSGKPHRYYFKLYALDTTLDLKEGAKKEQLHDAMKGHILAEGHLMGTYQSK